MQQIKLPLTICGREFHDTEVASSFGKRMQIVSYAVYLLYVPRNFKRIHLIYTYNCGECMQFTIPIYRSQTRVDNGFLRFADLIKITKNLKAPHRAIDYGHALCYYKYNLMQVDIINSLALKRDQESGPVLPAKKRSCDRSNIDHSGQFF